MEHSKHSRSKSSDEDGSHSSKKLKVSHHSHRDKDTRKKDSSRNGDQEKDIPKENHSKDDFKEDDRKNDDRKRDGASEEDRRNDDFKDNSRKKEERKKYDRENRRNDNFNDEDRKIDDRRNDTSRDYRRRDDRRRDDRDNRSGNHRDRRHRNDYRHREDLDRHRNRDDNRKYVSSKEETNKENVGLSESKKEAQDIDEKKIARKDDINLKTGGAYIPPAKLRMMAQNITDKSSAAFQRLAWEALKKSIHGLINKVNVANIGIIVRSLFKENIVRGKGLLCRSLLQAQAASIKFTNVYAALIAVVNSKFPHIGELLIQRCVNQFKNSYRRNDKSTCLSAATFIAHLVNQRMLHEIAALQILHFLLFRPTNDSVEIAIAFLKECGEKLGEVSPKGLFSVFDSLRKLLQEGDLDKRVQYMIEVMYQVRKDKFKDYPALIEDLDLIDEEEQIQHLISIDDKFDNQDILNVFRHDPEYEENEDKYKQLCKEILGDEESDEDGEEGDSEGSDDSEAEDADPDSEKNLIRDETETNLVAFRRTVYLTINSSLDFEECAHKLLKMQIKPGQETELCHMFLDCCTQQRTYEKFFGLLAQRFCQINRIYVEPLKQIFVDSYHTIHRLDTNRLRNVAKFFAHLLYSDAIPWTVLAVIRLSEDDTTPSGRVFIKILFQELSEYMGLQKLRARLSEPEMEEAVAGLFPKDNPKSTRFSINFFTLIGLGGLTDDLREWLKNGAVVENNPPVIEAIQEAVQNAKKTKKPSPPKEKSKDKKKEKEKKKKKKTTTNTKKHTSSKESSRKSRRKRSPSTSSSSSSSSSSTSSSSSSSSDSSSS